MQRQVEPYALGHGAANRLSRAAMGIGCVVATVGRNKLDKTMV